MDGGAAYCHRCSGRTEERVSPGVGDRIHQSEGRLIFVATSFEDVSVFRRVDFLVDLCIISPSFAQLYSYLSSAYLPRCLLLRIFLIIDRSDNHIITIAHSLRRCPVSAPPVRRLLSARPMSIGSLVSCPLRLA